MTSQSTCVADLTAAFTWRWKVEMKDQRKKQKELQSLVANETYLLSLAAKAT